jgi:hypothetical protein
MQASEARQPIELLFEQWYEGQYMGRVSTAAFKERLVEAFMAGAKIEGERRDAWNRAEGELHATGAPLPPPQFGDVR